MLNKLKRWWIRECNPDHCFKHDMPTGGEKYCFKCREEFRETAAEKFQKARRKYYTELI